MNQRRPKRHKRRSRADGPDLGGEFRNLVEGIFGAFGMNTAELNWGDRFDTPPKTAAARPVPNCIIPDAMLRKLIILCHPDKHNNSELSSEVTRWLIEQGNFGGKPKRRTAKSA